MSRTRAVGIGIDLGATSSAELFVAQAQGGTFDPDTDTDSDPDSDRSSLNTCTTMRTVWSSSPARARFAGHDTTWQLGTEHADP